MKLVIRNDESFSNIIEVVACHDNEEVVWSIRSLDKGYVNDTYDVFEHINAYWVQLEKQNKLIVDKVFDLYKQIRVVFDENWDRNQLTQKLYQLVADLLDQHDLNDVQLWVVFHSDIIFPDTNVLKTDYVASPDRPGTREQTYLKEDYVKLISMAVVLRAMNPIWGEFIGRTRSEAGTTFKEYYAFRLLVKSKLARSEAMEKLQVYVEYSTAAGKNKAASIIGGVSSEDFAGWVLGLVVTRKLCAGDLRGLEPQTTLVTYIYNYIHQKVMGIDNSFNGTAGMIKDKSFDEKSQEGERNLSRLEGYKAKQEIPAGDIIALEYSMIDAYAIANRLAPGIDQDLIKSALKTTEVLSNSRVFDCQILLLQWIMKPIVPTRGIQYLSKKTIVRLQAVCQAVLLHRGHKELAGLVTATASMNGDEIQVSGVDSRARIPKEMVDELNTLFPFMKRPSGKQKTIKLLNQAVLSIDSMTEKISSSDWILTIEEKFVRDLTGSLTNRRYSIPHNIKVLLTDLVLKLAKRTY